MKHTIRELRQATPTLSRIRTLTAHFGVRDEQIELEPWRPLSVGDRRSEVC
jgi:hypothetical protein